MAMDHGQERNCFMTSRPDTTRHDSRSSRRLTTWFADWRARRRSAQRQARALKALTREPDWLLDDIGVDRAELVAKLLAYRGIG